MRWGVSARPACTGATFNPATERRWAAQPPVAPEPTTIALYVHSRTSCAMELLFVGRLVRSNMDRLCGCCGATAVVVEIAAGVFFAPAQFLLTNFRPVVGGGNHGLKPFEMFLGGVGLGLVLPSPMAGVAPIRP